MAFSLALHELATNAAKYGALSNRDGKVSIRWGVNRGRPDEQTFTLTWREHDGPPVARARTLGFGCTTIEKSLAQAVDGNVTLDFDPHGLICAIAAPLTERFGVVTTESPPVIAKTERADIARVSAAGVL